jgi:hypothetical protein
MENLLLKDYINYHSVTTNLLSISQITKESYFEIDDINNVIIIKTSKGDGMVKYENPLQKEISIIDYDNFFSSIIPLSFQVGKKRCDLIVHTLNDQTYFLLNELKAKNNAFFESDNIEGAKKQLISTLTEIFTVQTLKNFINLFTNKICCYCNSYPKSPSIVINATSAFNRLNMIAPDGLQLSEPRIEAFGFSYFEYKGNQTIKLV